MENKIIAVDFDGTLCENEWPKIGVPHTDVIEYIKARKAEGAKIILWTNRVEERLDEAVQWCSEQELYFDAVNDNLPEIVESFGTNCRKIFANEYIDDRNVLVSSCHEKSNMEKWAEEEVRIACVRIACEREAPEWDYRRACYESALKAFKSLLEDGHSGMSIGFTKAILNRLIDGKPLCPIEDTDDTWDEAVQWCSEQELYFDAVNDNLMEKWAEEEVRIACKHEAPNRREGEWDYGCACYESALKAFKSLLEDRHSGMSIGFTKAILNRLIDGKPLCPIEDTDDTWYDVSDRYGVREKGVEFQCKRMSSLFKDVSTDGTVRYHDVNRYRGVDINNSNAWYHNGLIDKLMEAMFPITMPYVPYDNPFEVYTESFLVDPKNGDYDTLGILYAITPSGDKVEINRYFKEVEDGFEEIDSAEYMERKESASAKTEGSNE